MEGTGRKKWVIWLKRKEPEEKMQNENIGKSHLRCREKRGEKIT